VFHNFPILCDSPQNMDTQRVIIASRKVSWGIHELDLSPSSFHGCTPVGHTICIYVISFPDFLNKLA
jgi:hypothetical protein